MKKVLGSAVDHDSILYTVLHIHKFNRESCAVRLTLNVSGRKAHKDSKSIQNTVKVVNEGRPLVPGA